MASRDTPWPGTEDWWESPGFWLAAGSDAGGLAHLRAFQSLLPEKVHLWTPAGRVGSSPKGGFSGLSKDLSEAQAAIVSTGWQSDFEQRVASSALTIGIPLFIVLDRWNDFDNRLHWLSPSDPVTLVVTDPFALVICEGSFPSRRTVLWPNAYEDSIRSDVVAHRELRPMQTKSTLLLGEPVERNLTTTVGQPEAMLRDAPHWLPDPHSVRDSQVTIRPHPSESPRKYEAIAQEMRSAGFHVELSNRPLAEDLAEAKTAIGVHTYALYLAARLGIQSYSIALRAGLISQFPPGCGVNLL